MKIFKQYDPEQSLLLPPDLRSWLPEAHLALFVSDVVEQMDLGEVLSAYETTGVKGQPPYNPWMLVKVLVYGYCIGVYSSRKLEKATWEDVPFRVLASNQHPDHDTIAAFRKKHLKALGNLFEQVLALCREAGLVKLGHVSIDGTKMKANASKHKAMSYEKMEETEKRLKEEVRRLLAEAERVDAEEDARFGQGVRGDELPEELQRRESRIKRIQEAKAALEARAKSEAQEAEREARERQAERERKEVETGKKARGKAPTIPDAEKAKPDPKSQYNFTDPDSRIMPSGGKKTFEQAYNCQAAVDEHEQIIVACLTTQETNDKEQLLPVLEEVRKNTGRLPERTSADSGYFSKAAVTAKSIQETDLYIPPDRQRHGLNTPDANDTRRPTTPVAEMMRNKIASDEGSEVYSRRKVIVEPVFGQIKEERKSRRFSFRGLNNVAEEWRLFCLVHNLMKLFRRKTGISQKVKSKSPDERKRIKQIRLLAAGKAV